MYIYILHAAECSFKWMALDKFVLRSDSGYKCCILSVLCSRFDVAALHNPPVKKMTHHLAKYQSTSPHFHHLLFILKRNGKHILDHELYLEQMKGKWRV